MAKIEGYKVDSMQESFTNSVTTTSYPVEKGLPLTDSVQRQPKTFSASGKILGKKAKNADEIRKNIEKKMNAGKPVKYVGRIKASDVLITNFTGTYDSTIGNGFSFSMDMQQVRVAKTPYRKKKTKKTTAGKKTVTKKASNTASNMKKYHTVKDGDTYSAVARKYGTTIAKLRQLNKWPDTKIPTGVKLRIN